MGGLDWNNGHLCQANLGRHQILCSKLHKQQRLIWGLSTDLDSFLELSKIILQSSVRKRQQADDPVGNSEIKLTHFADFLKTVFLIDLGQFQWIPQPFL